MSHASPAGIQSIVRLLLHEAGRIGGAPNKQIYPTYVRLLECHIIEFIDSFMLELDTPNADNLVAFMTSLFNEAGSIEEFVMVPFYDKMLSTLLDPRYNHISQGVSEMLLSMVNHISHMMMLDIATLKVTNCTVNLDLILLMKKLTSIDFEVTEEIIEKFDKLFKFCYDNLKGPIDLEIKIELISFIPTLLRYDTSAREQTTPCDSEIENAITIVVGGNEGKKKKNSFMSSKSEASFNCTSAAVPNNNRQKDKTSLLLDIFITSLGILMSDIKYPDLYKLIDTMGFIANLVDIKKVGEIFNNLIKTLANKIKLNLNNEPALELNVIILKSLLKINNASNSLTDTDEISGVILNKDVLQDALDSIFTALEHINGSNIGSIGLEQNVSTPPLDKLIPNLSIPELTQVSSTENSDVVNSSINVLYDSSEGSAAKGHKFKSKIKKPRKTIILSQANQKVSSINKNLIQSCELIFANRFTFTFLFMLENMQNEKYSYCYVMLRSIASRFTLTNKKKYELKTKILKNLRRVKRRTEILLILGKMGICFSDSDIVEIYLNELAQCRELCNEMERTMCYCLEQICNELSLDQVRNVLSKILRIYNMNNKLFNLELLRLINIYTSIIIEKNVTVKFDNLEVLEIYTKLMYYIILRLSIEEAPSLDQLVHNEICEFVINFSLLNQNDNYVFKKLLTKTIIPIDLEPYYEEFYELYKSDIPMNVFLKNSVHNNHKLDFQLLSPTFCDYNSFLFIILLESKINKLLNTKSGFEQSNQSIQAPTHNAESQTREPQPLLVVSMNDSFEHQSKMTTNDEKEDENQMIEKSFLTASDFTNLQLSEKRESESYPALQSHALGMTADSNMCLDLIIPQLQAQVQDMNHSKINLLPNILIGILLKMLLLNIKEKDITRVNLCKSYNDKLLTGVINIITDVYDGIKGQTRDDSLENFLGYVLSLLVIEFSDQGIDTIIKNVQSYLNDYGMYLLLSRVCLHKPSCIQRLIRKLDYPQIFQRSLTNMILLLKKPKVSSLFVDDILSLTINKKSITLLSCVYSLVLNDMCAKDLIAAVERRINELPIKNEGDDTEALYTYTLLKLTKLMIEQNKIALTKQLVDKIYLSLDNKYYEPYSKEIIIIISDILAMYLETQSINTFGQELLRLDKYFWTLDDSLYYELYRTITVKLHSLINKDDRWKIRDYKQQEQTLDFLFNSVVRLLIIKIDHEDYFRIVVCLLNIYLLLQKEDPIEFYDFDSNYNSTLSLLCKQISLNTQLSTKFIYKILDIYNTKRFEKEYKMYISNVMSLIFLQMSQFSENMFGLTCEIIFTILCDHKNSNLYAIANKLMMNNVDEFIQIARSLEETCVLRLLNYIKGNINEKIRKVLIGQLIRKQEELQNSLEPISKEIEQIICKVSSSIGSGIYHFTYRKLRKIDDDLKTDHYLTICINQLLKPSVLDNCKMYTSLIYYNLGCIYKLYVKYKNTASKHEKTELIAYISELNMLLRLIFDDTSTCDKINLSQDQIDFVYSLLAYCSLHIDKEKLIKMDYMRHTIIDSMVMCLTVSEGKGPFSLRQLAENISSIGLDSTNGYDLASCLACIMFLNHININSFIELFIKCLTMEHNKTMLRTFVKLLQKHYDQLEERAQNAETNGENVYEELNKYEETVISCENFDNFIKVIIGIAYKENELSIEELLLLMSKSLVINKYETIQWSQETVCMLLPLIYKENMKMLTIINKNIVSSEQNIESFGTKAAEDNSTCKSIFKQILCKLDLYILIQCITSLIKQSPLQAAIFIHKILEALSEMGSLCLKEPEIYGLFINLTMGLMAHADTEVRTNALLAIKYLI